MKKHWYHHLNGNGFDDIEKDGNLRTTQFSHSTRIAYQTEDTFEAMQKYFLWAGQMAKHAIFKTDRDQIIWEYHSENLSRREISRRIGLGDRWISREIHRIKEYLTASSQCALYA